MTNPTQALAPHHTGHRARLRARFLQGGPQALADYELVELLLTFAIPRRDVKPLAKQLLTTFGSLDGLLKADASTLAATEGIGEQAAALVHLVGTLALQARKQNVPRKSLGSQVELLDYLYEAMGHLQHEEFRVLYLNKQLHLIDDIVLFTGTIDEAAVYPREIIKTALARGATALILVHNHPSGDPQPSNADILLTHQVQMVAEPLRIQVIDHIIIGADRHYSLAGHGQL